MFYNKKRIFNTDILLKVCYDFFANTVFLIDIEMKRLLILMFICIHAFMGSVHATDMAHYVGFVRSFGIIRYFSPNPYTQNWSESDWMKVCALLADRVETQSLETVFQPLAPTLFFSAVPDKSGENIISQKTPLYYYCYSGSGELDIPFIAKVFTPGLADYMPYFKKLSVASDFPDSEAAPIAGRYYSYKVAEGKFLNIQHSLQKEVFDSEASGRLLKAAKKYWDSQKSKDNSLPKRRRVIFGLLSDKAVRIADLTVRWNIVRHFYPYYEEDNIDWDHQLEIYLQQAVQVGEVDSSNSVLEWYNLVCRFLSPIKDGHLFVRNDMLVSCVQSTYLPEFYVDVETKSVNDSLLIRTGIDGTKTWRVLHSINGQPASERLKDCRMVTNAATDAHRDRMAVDKLFCASEHNTPFVIESKGLSGEMRLDTLYARRPEPLAAQNANPPLQKYGNGILYIDATSPEVNEKRFLSELTPDVKGLCFDLRGLPSLQFENILAHLIGSDVKAPAAEVPVNCFPFQQETIWRIEAETLKAKLPHIDLPVTFLCDAGTVSWGETILMMVRQYGLGEIVGQTTAGTTGDMTHFNLPLFPFSMTGMRMHCMDGKQHHAKGIVPDREVVVYASDYMIDFDRTLYMVLNT